MSDEIRKDETNEDGELLTARLRAAKKMNALSDGELSDVSGGGWGDAPRYGNCKHCNYRFDFNIWYCPNCLETGDARELNEAFADPEALMGDADGWDD